jgi:hypothetical protein
MEVGPARQDGRGFENEAIGPDLALDVLLKMHLLWVEVPSSVISWLTPSQSGAPAGTTISRSCT